MVDAPSLSKQKSTVPTSCTQVESTVLPVSITKAWSSFRGLDLATVAPKIVSSSEFISGAEGQVGSVVKISYTSGAVWELRVIEFSERNHVVAYEILSTEPAHSVTSIQGEFKFSEVTDEDHVFVQWTTEFSNDADYTIIADQKYKKQDFFAQVKANLS